jgi:hypothetical protein
MLKHCVMKRFLILLSALAFLAPVRVSAQDSGNAFSVAAGISAGVMDGAGASLAFGVTDNLNIRAGFSFIPSSLIPEIAVDLPKWGSNPASSTAFSGSFSPTGSLLIDYHPFGGIFHITAGAFIGSSDFAKAYNTKALPESYRNAGISYYVDGDKDDVTKFYRIQADEKGIVHGALKAASVRPFVGIGLGSAIPQRRVSAAFDLGMEYTGGLKTCTDARNIKGDLETITMTSDEIMDTIYGMRGSTAEMSYDKYVQYVDKLASLPVLPVLRLSLFVKLF